MKCPNCRRNMDRKVYHTTVNDQPYDYWYYECRHCGRAISKPIELMKKESKEAEEKKDEV